MPKIIENLRQRLLEETGRQLRERGYAAVTVRSVARACAIGVGTVYNYFPSKDDMIAACLLADWEGCVAAVRRAADGAADAEPVLRALYDALSGFAAAHAALFGDPAALPGYAGFARRYHGVLRAQLAAPLRRFCRDEFTAEFIAEAMLTWTLSGRAYEEICGPLRRLL